MSGLDQNLGMGAGGVPQGVLSPTAQGGDRTKNYRLNAVNLNQAATDLGSFTGLPSSYRVLRLTALNASTSLTLATLDLRTAAAGAARRGRRQAGAEDTQAAWATAGIAHRFDLAVGAV